MTLSRRSFFTGLAAAVAAPAVVRASSIMPVKPIPWRVVTTDWAGSIGRYDGFPFIVSPEAAADYIKHQPAEVVRALIDKHLVLREFATREEAENVARLATMREADRHGQGTSFFDEVQRTITVGQISDVVDLCWSHETIITTISTPPDLRRNMADEIVREFAPRRLPLDAPRGKGRGRL